MFVRQDVFAGCDHVGELQRVLAADRRERQAEAADDVENLSQIWAVAPALVKLALRDVEPSQKDKEPPWKRIAKGRRWAM